MEVVYFGGDSRKQSEEVESETGKQRQVWQRAHFCYGPPGLILLGPCERLCRSNKEQGIWMSIHQLFSLFFEGHSWALSSTGHQLAHNVIHVTRECSQTQNALTFQGEPRGHMQDTKRVCCNLSPKLVSRVLIMLFIWFRKIKILIKMTK